MKRSKNLGDHNLLGTEPVISLGRLQSYLEEPKVASASSGALIPNR